MSDVRQQLTEALDEAERLATGAPRGPWVIHDGCMVSDSRVIALMPDGLNAAVAAHVARWDPVTVLRLVAFFRDLVERHRSYLDDLHSRVPIAKCFTDDEEWPCDDIEQAAAFWLGTPEADHG